MSNATQLQPVLDRIDADFDNSLERLFALLRIKSIWAEPAFAGDCKAAADHLAKDIATLGFAAAMLLGISDVAGKYYVPATGAFLIYLVMIVLLMWRPSGLFGRR